MWWIGSQRNEESISYYLLHWCVRCKFLFCIHQNSLGKPFIFVCIITVFSDVLWICSFIFGALIKHSNWWIFKQYFFFRGINKNNYYRNTIDFWWQSVFNKISFCYLSYPTYPSLTKLSVSIRCYFVNIRIIKIW